MILAARFKALASGFRGNLGRCDFCMRTSFCAALLSWAMLAAALRWAPGDLSDFAVGLAIPFTLLWLAHLGAAAARTAARERDVDEGRRDSLLVFVRAFAIAAATTALPAAMAKAQSESCLSCTHTVSCLDRNGNVPCCPQSTPYLCTIDCQCYADTRNCSSYYQCTGQ
jgi:hypothetical protein